MNTAALQGVEDLFGPPSEPIVIEDFLAHCAQSSQLESSATAVAPLWDEWEGLNAEAKSVVERECSVEEHRKKLDEIISDPSSYAYMVRAHDEILDSFKEAKTGARAKKAPKRKRAEAFHVEMGQQPSVVIELQAALDAVQLKCWPYTTDSSAFARPQKNSDVNVLTTIRRSSEGAVAVATEERTNTGLIIVSVYNRLTWGNHLSRSSQHALLSSQTLGDLYGVIPCTSNEIPAEGPMEQPNLPFREDTAPPHLGAIMIIEGTAYGDGQVDGDYSSKFLRHIETLPDNKRPQMSKGPALHDQVLSKLSLRINQPYWLVHQGNCEHFLVVDHIRLLHPSDARDGYPLTLFVAPPLLDLCQACSRVPATISIIGDIRLGQSPCKLCRPCWKILGPADDENVKIAPLPKFCMDS